MVPHRGAAVEAGAHAPTALQEGVVMSSGRYGTASERPLYS